MIACVIDFAQLERSSIPLAGGKGANLGEMTRAGFPVPPGFCVTTDAYQAFIEQSGEMEAYLEQLGLVRADQLEEIARLGSSIRSHLSALPIPEAVSAEILAGWSRLGESLAYAVRSSATAEDLPNASFAGQQDTYLNVCGGELLLHAVRQCWASLFTDRAISYRAQHRFDHRAVRLAVVVQEMVFPEVSGIMFTADPISGRRKTVSIDASFGLGEALVSGLVTPDLYQVRAGELLSKSIARKKVVIRALPAGGTVTEELPEAQQELQALTDEQIIQLAAWGEKLDRHYGSEQDVEWCLAGGQFYLVQSRPITSLYPLPHVPVAPGESAHLLLSFGHQQMMTSAMKPMALSVWGTAFPFGKPSLRSESELVYKAGGRIYVDITRLFLLKPARKLFPKAISHMDERIGSGVAAFIGRDDFLWNLPAEPGLRRRMLQFMGPVAARVLRNLLFARTDRAAQRISRRIEEILKEGRDRLSGPAGPDKVVRVQEQLGMLMRRFFRELVVFPLPGVIAFRLIQFLAQRWLGDADVVYVLNKSLPGNVTSEMGLMIGDLADSARRYPQVAELIHSGEPSEFRERLRDVEGGEAFGREWDRFMELYGMRCPGEIDITRPRWREDPGTLLPSIDSHMRSVPPGEHRVKFAQGAREAEEAARDLLMRLRRQPLGRIKAKLMGRLLKVFRGLMALREHPKYALIQQFGLVREVMLEDARRWVREGVLEQEEDLFYLTLDEWLTLSGGGALPDLRQRLAQRKQDYERYCTLKPPRLMTSEGELITGRSEHQHAPAGALLGTPVSAGVVEGIARVVLRPEEARLSKGEILIAPFTDPGWTPLFHSAAGLVMEVGGLMTHGAVVAREYGLPAVAGIDAATERIRDGDYIRLDGTAGYVLVLKQ